MLLYLNNFTSSFFFFFCTGKAGIYGFERCIATLREMCTHREKAINQIPKSHKHMRHTGVKNEMAHCLSICLPEASRVLAPEIESKEAAIFRKSLLQSIHQLCDKTDFLRACPGSKTQGQNLPSRVPIPPIS